MTWRRPPLRMPVCSQPLSVRLTVWSVVLVISAISRRVIGNVISIPSSVLRPDWRTRRSTARAIRCSTLALATSRNRTNASIRWLPTVRSAAEARRGWRVVRSSHWLMGQEKGDAVDHSNCRTGIVTTIEKDRQAEELTRSYQVGDDLLSLLGDLLDLQSSLQQQEETRSSRTLNKDAASFRDFFDPSLQQNVRAFSFWKILEEIQILDKRSGRQTHAPASGADPRAPVQVARRRI